MATENVGILTNAGQALLQQVNAGKTKITYTRVVFSTDDNSQLADADVKALTDVKTQNVTIKPPIVMQDPQTGETIIRAVGDNKNLTDGIYIHTYGVYAADDSGKEVLYGVTVTSTPDYLVGFDGRMAQAVAYSYRANIQDTDNVHFTDAGDVYLMKKDLQGYLANYVQVYQLADYAKTVDVNQQLDKKVNVSDMRKPASDVAGIDEVNVKQDKIGYTPADDSKVVHKTGTEEIAGQKTFDIAPIDKTTGNPYITKDGVPSLPSDLARTGQANTFTAAQTFSSAPTVLDTSSSKGDSQVAVMGDLKSVENSAWHQLNVNISETNYTCTGLILYREINSSTLEVTGNVFPYCSSIDTETSSQLFPIFQLSDYSELSSTSIQLYLSGPEGGSSGVNVYFKGNTAYIGNIDVANASGNLDFIVTYSTKTTAMVMGAVNVSFTK